MENTSKQSAIRLKDEDESDLEVIGDYMRSINISSADINRSSKVRFAIRSIANWIRNQK